MPKKVHQDIKLFLEDKPSLKGQQIWNNWYDNPESINENEISIASDISKLKKEIRAIKKTNKVIFLNRNWIMAASIVLTAGLLSFFYLTSESVVTKQYAAKFGEHTKITLSDGTQIWLNAGSLLKYPSKFNGDTREVFLTGEAFFDVAKDKKHPFIIHTDKMDTKVLGTSFNVQAYPGQATQEVSVLTGRVNVKSTVTDENVYVTPGQKVVFKSKNSSLHAFSNIPMNSISLWRKNIIVFEDTPLTEVVATIKRNYNITVDVENKNLNNLKISAYFKELPAEQVIGLVCNIINANYKLESGVYKIN